MFNVHDQDERLNIAFHSSYEITANDPAIIAAQKQIASASEKDILSGVLTLHSLLVTQEDVCLQFINDQTIQRLIELVKSTDSDFQIKNQILGFVSSLCKVEKTFTHKFWHNELQTVLIAIISEDSPSVLLTPPIEILSEMANWTKISFNILINNFNLINILLRKLTLPLSIPDQYGVLNGLSSLLGSKWPKSDAYVIEIIKALYSLLANSNLNDQILGKTFKVISLALGTSNEDEDEPVSAQNDPILQNIDLRPLCQSAVELLQTRKRGQTQVEIIEFMCNAVYRSDEIANIFLELNTLDIFHKLCRLASEDSIIQTLITVSNCLISSPNTNNFLFNSKYLNDAAQYLHYGTQKIKIEALRMFNNIIFLKSRFFNATFARNVLEKYDILDVLGDFLHIDESDSASMLILCTCLNCIYSSIVIYQTTGCEMPSPPIQLMLEESNYEEMMKLSEFNELTIQELATLIKNEVKPFVPS
ncbi:hypothetical protein M9Y10_044828 [Tritrichomonas musculus]|uniref:Uncharacterized protein n=1 Tax=Tritrichomonas musculus TaxID=1915356 RepID=A0ABR2JTR0_9EUKA